MSVLKMSIDGETPIYSGSCQWEGTMETLREDAGLYNRHAVFFFGPVNDMGGYSQSCSLSGLKGQCSTLVAYNLPRFKGTGLATVAQFTQILHEVAGQMGYAMAVATIATNPPRKGENPANVDEWLATGLWELSIEPFINYRTDLMIYHFNMRVDENE